MPRVIEFLNEAAIDPRSQPGRYEHSRPAVIEVSVPEGATDVDPALTEIVVRFNRRMGPATSVLPRIPDYFPRIEQTTWNESFDACTITLALEPGRAWEIYLNAPGAGNFSSDEGVWMKPVTLWFRTRDAEPPPEGAAR
jgi:hypothetical protein